MIKSLHDAVVVRSSTQAVITNGIRAALDLHLRRNCCCGVTVDGGSIGPRVCFNSKRRRHESVNSGWREVQSPRVGNSSMKRTPAIETRRWMSEQRTDGE